MLEGWFDGACGPRNPGGHAAWGAVLCRGVDLVWQKSGYVGCGSAMSNNVAEYAGLAALLERLQGETEHCLIRGDSNLVIMQMTGKWGVKGGLYLPYYRIAEALLAPIYDRVSFAWVPREENTVCDDLSKTLIPY